MRRVVTETSPIGVDPVRWTRVVVRSCCLGGSVGLGGLADPSAHACASALDRSSSANSSNDRGQVRPTATTSPDLVRTANSRPQAPGLKSGTTGLAENERRIETSTTSRNSIERCRPGEATSSVRSVSTTIGSARNAPMTPMSACIRRIAPAIPIITRPAPERNNRSNPGSPPLLTMAAKAMAAQPATKHAVDIHSVAARDLKTIMSFNMSPSAITS
jgi:hypothetical protein